MTVERGLRRLESARQDGALAALCRRHEVALMVLFGSATVPGARPRDIDIAVRFARGVAGDVIAVVADLVRLAASDSVDVMDLGRASPVARYEALGGGSRVLFEADPTVFAQAQMSAVRDYLDTRRLRRLQLELMSA